MKELVEQVMETQKNVKVAQTKLLKGRQQMGTAGGGGGHSVPSHGSYLGPAPALLLSDPLSTPWLALSSGGDRGEPGAATAQCRGGQGGAEAAL